MLCRPRRQHAERDAETADIPLYPFGILAAHMTAKNRTAPQLSPLPGFDRDANGKPIIALDDASLYAWGHLLRLTEQLILELFSRGLLSGTTHTCLGQELCQLAVVRALRDPDDVVLSNHRNHGHFMTYAGHFVGLVAEIMPSGTSTATGCKPV